MAKGSFSKRHASLSSPREIPLPSSSRPTSPLDEPTTPMPTPWLDRCSSASLPPHSQIPFYALQRLSDSQQTASSSSSSSNDDASIATSFDTDVSLDKPTPSPPLENEPPSQSHEYTAMCRFMSHPPTTPLPDSSSYPPPDPPIILPIDPPDDSALHPTRPRPPYVPFLSPAPPPPDSWIQVETTTSEYRLHVRLPGFSREGITLATRRRRILHVVADRWGEGGGQ
jgi:hypothetical protein